MHLFFVFNMTEKKGNSFEVLPTGWINVRHGSGVPLYFHRDTRVCTWSKPYFLGTGSVRVRPIFELCSLPLQFITQCSLKTSLRRHVFSLLHLLMCFVFIDCLQKHSIPLSAIPCLAYRKALDREKQDQNETSFSSQVSPQSVPIAPCGIVSNEAGKPDSALPGSSTSNLKRIMNKECPMEIQNGDSSVPKPPLPCAKVETAEENNTLHSLEPKELREYCNKLFIFKTLEYRRFR